MLFLYIVLYSLSVSHWLRVYSKFWKSAKPTDYLVIYQQTNRLRQTCSLYRLRKTCSLYAQCLISDYSANCVPCDDVFVVSFFKTMNNKTITRFVSCDILNNEGRGKCYQSRPWVITFSSTSIISDITKTSSNNCLLSLSSSSLLLLLFYVWINVRYDSYLMIHLQVPGEK